MALERFVRRLLPEPNEGHCGQVASWALRSDWGNVLAKSEMLVSKNRSLEIVSFQAGPRPIPKRTALPGRIGVSVSGRYRLRGGSRQL